VWRAESEGLRLKFHLAGINNQNFLMTDEETGTYWQQISGLAVSGPLAGRHLTLVPSDELTWALWKTENPAGTVLTDSAPFVTGYARKDWDVRMRRAPTVLSFPEKGVAQRDIMLGIQAFGASRAFPYDTVLKGKLIEDRVGSEPIILVVGPDDQSVRVFQRRIPGVAVETPEFYRTSADRFMDDATGSSWNFQGCAVSGKSQGKCLARVEVIKDYWFDWRNYNPATTIYRQPQ
jgi:Protein of unknown function (DUF3179)